MTTLRMFIAGASAAINIGVAILLVFVNGIVTKPITDFLFGWDFGTEGAVGIDMIPVIQWSLSFICLAVGIVSIYFFFQEAFGAVTYEQEL